MVNRSQKVRIITSSTDSKYVLDGAKTWSQNLFSQGFYKNTPLCSGLGKCGYCKLQFISRCPELNQKDTACLPLDMTDEGWRMGCAHCPEDGQIVRIDLTGFADSREIASVSPAVALGIDIGTTSVKWMLKHQDGLISQGEGINPQMGAGPDIMSRLSYALHGSGERKFLGRLLAEQVKSILGITKYHGQQICIAGNPAMIYFLLGLDVAGIAAAPYFNAYKGCSWEALSAGRKAFFPALWSPFIGADISAGLNYILKELRPEYPFLLVDFGTNGEMVLAAAPDNFLSTSVAMGPALEGIGLRLGSPYRQGVATAFRLDKAGIYPQQPGGTGKISGSGYISLTSLLKKLKVISKTGQFMVDSNPLVERICSNLHEGRLQLGQGLHIDGHDIEEILKVKAAFTLGLSFLCQKSQIMPQDLKKIYIAGALGQHSSPADLEILGFFPAGSSHKSYLAGNTALKGAMLLAENEEERQRNKELSGFVKTLNLGSEQDYIAEHYVRHMVFEYAH